MNKPFRSGPKRLADLVRPALGPALAKRGLSQASLILDWPVIAGEALGKLCEPARLQWPSRGPKSDPTARGTATLWLRVAPGRGLDVQYRTPVIMERVNAHFGWRCVAKIAIAPEPKRNSAPPSGPLALPPAALARAAARVGGDIASVPDADLRFEGLRGALTRLGAGVFMRSR